MTNSTEPIRTAVIIAVGSELLTPYRSDTNSLAVTAALNRLGVILVYKVVVGDEERALEKAVRAALSAADLVVTTGGLGPTSDDLTRPAVARVLGLQMDEDPNVVAAIEARFARRGLAMPAINRAQAQVPRGATVVPNGRGTAPGLWMPAGRGAVLLLPGPPGEMQPMLEAALENHVAPRSGSRRVLRRVLKITGLTESQADTIAQPVYGPLALAPTSVATTILAAPGQIELHLSLVSDDLERGTRALDGAVGGLAAVLGDDVYSTDGRSLEAVVGELLQRRGWRIVLAESCTGGLTTSRLTDVPGASAWLERAVVCYSNESKTDLLGVSGEVLTSHGAVSEEVALRMAEGARRSCGVEVGVGVTGIAGPSGGSERKPVGTVCIAVSWPGGERVRTFVFPGLREQVKWQSSQAALDMVRRAIESASGGTGVREDGP